MNKTIRNIGLVLFFAGFGFFVALFFLSDYKLTNDVIQQEFEIAATPAPNPVAQQLSVEEESRMPYTLYAVVKQETERLLGKTYATDFAFVDVLQKVFQQANERIEEIYSISEEEIKEIVALTKSNKLTYKVEDAFAVLEGPEELVAYKRKGLKDYTGWLEGRSFEDEAQFEEQLRSAIANLNAEVVKNKGINPYAEKGLLTAIVKKAATGFVPANKLLVLLLSVGLSVLGGLLYILPRMKDIPGIKNEGIFFSSLKNRGWIGILLGTFLILFYIVLYFYPYYMTNWILIVDPLSYWIKGSPAGEFFLYGFLYTLAILVMGVRMLIKYRHSNYHKIRTVSVMFFQLAFAFLIAEILVALNKPYFDFKNIWPLNYDFFFEYRMEEFLSSGKVGMFMLIWGIALIVLAVPLMTYFFGKRWYCSWVCGCGGLAETMGDPFRQLSDKSLKAWQIERWMVHSVLVFAVIMTIAVLYTFFTGNSELFGINSYVIRSWYGFGIGAIFAGVVGTGFYPLMGNRVWCRFGCPLAAYIGIVQRFRSRFRITTNGGQCISCGNCSTYCEMGIDVRWYAQRGQNVVRASCVGCGVCASVCPRGVLKLENDNPDGRFGKPILIGNDHITVVN